MNAWLALREAVHYRREAFCAGLESLGYTIQPGATRAPGRDDVLVVWNRYGAKDEAARAFEAAGRPVLVAENGYLGNEFAGSRWYAIARTHHNGAGWWPVGSRDRWDALKVPLAPWREPSGEIVVLPQRGIGPKGVAMPSDWLARTQERLKGLRYRVRLHPGTRECVSLEEDLQAASTVITWGSGAALKALTMGIRVRSDMPRWIGEQDNSDAGRLSMFRRLAWAQWTLPEIADGTAFRALL